MAVKKKAFEFQYCLSLWTPHTPISFSTRHEPCVVGRVQGRPAGEEKKAGTTIVKLEEQSINEEGETYCAGGFD